MAPDPQSDPLASTRITLAGYVEHPEGDELAAAREAHLTAVPAARIYIDFSDFSLWVLRVQRVRWSAGTVGWIRPPPRHMPSTAGSHTPSAGRAIAHLNADHADALSAMAQKLGGFPDATAATCVGADRYGLDLDVTTPRGRAMTRAGFSSPLNSADELRAATVELTRQARQGPTATAGR